MHPTFSVDVLNGEATVTVVGDVGLESAAALRDAIQSAFMSPGVTAVIVDVSGVTFLDSSALGILVAARRSAQQRAVGFGVRNPGAMVTMVLRITSLYDMLVISPEKDSRPDELEGVPPSTVRSTS